MIGILWYIQMYTSSSTLTGLTYAVITGAALFSFLLSPLIDAYKPAKVAGFSLGSQAVFILLISLISPTDGWMLVVLIILVFLASVMSSVFYPADNALITKIVTRKEELNRANSLVSTTDQIVNMMGFLLAGSLISFLGSRNSFHIAFILILLSSILYLLLSKRLKKDERQIKFTVKNHFTDLRTALKFIKDNRYLRILLPFCALSNSVMAILIILLPSISMQHGSAFFYSFIYVSFFVGFLVGAVICNFIKSSGFYVAFAWLGNGVCLFPLVFFDNSSVFFVCIFSFGTFSGILNVNQITMIQSMTEENMMGRVMGALTTFNNVATPAGSIVGALLALVLPTNYIFLLCGLVLTACGCILLSNKYVINFQQREA
ncbi:hypothetical protein AC622_07060 [Bacillus sp. FJAT-27916]|nr:hypothetical protein AC622_07060 [Bacillus sp. FJAT-27916]